LITLAEYIRSFASPIIARRILRGSAAFNISTRAFAVLLLLQLPEYNAATQSAVNCALSVCLWPTFAIHRRLILPQKSKK
jgi:hypothetical protein